MTATAGAPDYRQARLTARPRPHGGPTTGRPGRHHLDDAVLVVPEECKGLLVVLHGAGMDATGALRIVPAALADDAGLMILAPASQGPTWDVIVGGYGPDVERLDAHLATVFERYAVDPGRVAVGGFSDGASYALSLGLTNGDLFGAVVAFSPGFAAPASRAGAPRLFLSHGTSDPILPIDGCSRQLAPRLETAGYDVTYREFEGGHTIPPAIAAEAVAWLGWD